MAEGRRRPAWAEVDLAAIRHNVSLLARRAAPASVCAVVKADAYGHGAVEVARAALDAGAAALAVAVVDEGVELRDAGVRAPVLLLCEPPPGTARTVVEAGLVPAVAGPDVLAELAAAARRARARVAVHVMVDTGMHRAGVAPPSAAALAASVRAIPELELDGVCTHLAVAEGSGAEDRDFTERQIKTFDRVVAALPDRPRVLHVANTAGAIAWPASRFDMVRCGIGVYGLPPSAEMAAPAGDATGAAGDATGAAGDATGVGDDANGRGGPAAGAGGAPSEFVARLRPALTLKARVSAVRELDAGARPSYGRLRPLPVRSVVATVPLGYADGVPRALFAAGFEVLVGGRRYPLAGMVTMDQLVVDCGPGSTVAPGDEVVLIGRQGTEEISAAAWAGMLGSITYEVVSGIGKRVPRHYVDGGDR